MELTIYFFFNLSLLIVLLFLGLLWFERSNNTHSIKVVAPLFFIVSLFICFTFSYSLHEGILLDFRNIPIVIGGLYMGLGPVLGLVSIVTRGFYGLDLWFWMLVLFYGVVSLALWKFSPYFLKQSSNFRISFSIVFAFIVSLIQIVPLSFMNLDFPVKDVYFAYLFVQPLGVGMISYFIEEMIKSTRLRQTLLKVKRLEAVEQMGAAISHEIRNPLTAAIGFVQLLQSDTISEESRGQYLSIVRNELKSAERVIHEYLALSKPQVKLNDSLVIEEEVQQVLQLLHPSALLNSVEFITNFSKGAKIKGDRQKFHQSLVNIIKNAIEAMPYGGILSIETKSTPTNVVISIRDTGLGMTPAQVERLGEPYYSTKGEKGTGLGILVVFSVIRAMNGTIHVESELGVGTTFEIMFSSFNTSFDQGEVHEKGLDFVIN